MVRILEDVAHRPGQLTNRLPTGRASVYPNISVVGPQQAIEMFGQRRLSRAVGTGECHELARFNRQTDSA